jgi:aminotransferase
MIDGGALWLRETEPAERARSLRYLGMKAATTSGVDSQVAGNARWWEYDLATTSGRFINNDVHAAIGRVQLKRLPGFIATRRGIWDTYNAELAGVGDLLLPPEPLEGCTSSYYMYWVQTDRRDELAAHLSKRGIYTTFRYFPLHQIKYYQSDAVLPNAERAAARTLNLPIHQNLGGNSLQRVIDAVKEFYE